MHILHYLLYPVVWGYLPPGTLLAPARCGRNLELSSDWAFSTTVALVERMLRSRSEERSCSVVAARFRRGVGGLVCSLAAEDARGRVDTGVEVLEPNRLVSRPLCRTKLESRHRSDKRGARAARSVLSQVYRLW